MLANCFTVTISSNNYSHELIRQICSEFGENIPKPLRYEGGEIGFITHLFCVNVETNVKKICDKYNFIMESLYKIEVDNSYYNNNYTIYPSYKTDGPRFYLSLE